jgi:hypothetical protein
MANQFRRWGDDGDPVVGADGGDARIAEYFTCRGCEVLTDVEDSSAGRVDDRGVGGVVVVEPRGGPVPPEGNAVGCVLALRPSSGDAVTAAASRANSDSSASLTKASNSARNRALSSEPRTATASSCASPTFSTAMMANPAFCSACSS